MSGDIEAFTHELVADEPRQLRLLCVSDRHRWRPPSDWIPFLISVDPSGSLLGALFRGVEISRLPTILRTGIDVEPPDAVFWADELDKAWEYGGWPKVLMAIDGKRAKKICIAVKDGVPASEIEQLRISYPTVRRDDARSLTWLSRLPDNDPRIGTDYERTYGFWLPGHQHEALRALFVVARPEDYGQVFAWAVRAGCHALKDCIAAKMTARQLLEASPATEP